MPALDPTPFLRGNPFDGWDGAPYPRIAAHDQSRVPPSTWHAAMTPAGVRLELDGDAVAVVVEYTTATGELGYRGEGGGRTFEAWTADGLLDRVPAAVGDGSARLTLTPRSGPVTVHLPEAMRPTILGVTPVDGAIVPAARGPRWVAYGDSILEGWVASAPALAWAARAARHGGLDLVNLGYAGAARGEIATAETIAALEADVITLSHGTNCWSTIPHSDAMVAAGLDAFLTIVRQGHPDTPVIVVSPIRRPDAETAPNRLGATLGSLRRAMEGVVRVRIDAGDARLVLLPGEPLLDDARLPDGIHPDDEGHRLLAQAVGAEVAAVLTAPASPTPAETGD